VPSPELAWLDEPTLTATVYPAAVGSPWNDAPPPPSEEEEDEEVVSSAHVATLSPIASTAAAGTSHPSGDRTL
jgi:hypothetical protein